MFANSYMQVVNQIGPEKIIAVSADNTGNTRVARELICSELPHVFNLPDPAHHLNNTWKDICALPCFSKVRRDMTGIWNLCNINPLIDN